ncbi:hypothetical protein So717_33880 [Roseobacter cerasinus]|uniref:Uncharacterized protein n=1 Tax=Roseobacter cerasinus TaxID=2602289 RepID=A0A640VXG0_9RHOB|nr:hypothetical protein [Roseobacter cerasinus]GFE51635.1 hypothetical protein So717_33880 [Roseobacter cerasinus]
MTTLITRLFEDQEKARYVKERAVFMGVPSRDMSVITKGSAEDDAGLTAKMQAAGVDDSALGTYLAHVKEGQAVFAVRATYKPLMAATKMRELLAKHDPLEAGNVVEDRFVPDGPQKASSILTEHPHFLTVPMHRTGYEGGPVTAGLGWPMLRARKPSNSVMKGGKFMSRSFWPMPLVSDKPRKTSVIEGGRHMSKSFWPMPLISRKPRKNSVIRGGDLPLSRALGWPPVS